MPKQIQGQYQGEGKSLAIVVSRFNSTISQRLLDGSLDALNRHGVAAENINLYWVPGAFEIPSVVQQILKTTPPHAVICLGAVIRGETPHFDYVSAEVTKGIAQLGMQASIPVIYGIVTAETQEQALDRSGIKMGNKGFEAAMSALEMISLYQQIR